MPFIEDEHRILVVDDDPSMQFFLGELLKKEGLRFDIAGTGTEAIERLKNNDYSLVLLDEKIPEMSGTEVLGHIKKTGYPTPVIMITAYGSKELALRAIQQGAYDFFTKPVDIDIVRTVISRAIERYELQRDLNALKTEGTDKILRNEIIVESDNMKRALELSKKVAGTDVTVLITGESGSGKELIARTIHKLSDRRDSPFVSVNCAAIPESLLESEFFGYEKGAFTGAARQHIGKFERAAQGTIFLDEIGDLSFGLQAKLLRVLQNKEIERLGSTKPVKVDIRLISATNKDLNTAIAEGGFREDLFYRVRVFEVSVPPLRERKKDIPLLADHFLKKYSKSIGKEITGISSSAIRFFLGYNWPGNVREMENLIQRAIILAEGDKITGETVIELMHLDDKSRPLAINVRERLETIKSEEEKKLIVDALTETRWKRTDAAARLGISRKSLFNKMKKYGLLIKH
ncbi:MAG: sigma-54-dependent Fis family transcriptional regulator [Nitrospirae bacterium]|nr:sigma-54-dependent Fis family transcriptional regulator [Nitrospirota bacterium]